ncbi:MAG: cytochrome c-type biogenesis protein CcmH [Alphaproteobacteria bacterium]|nr:cytochrome c-type biogenesis protein CcmH [Alphaproteobacteria bacterium]
MFNALSQFGRSVLGFALVLAIALTHAPAPVSAVEPDEILADPKLERRARDISLELRCLVCQNQSIDDSDAPLARDLRLMVRERLKKGDSNSQVIDAVVSRYGEFVLLKPPFGWHTLLLWLTPILVLGGGIWLARSVLRTSQGTGATAELSGAQAAPLSAEEEGRLKQILERDQKA